MKIQNRLSDGFISQTWCYRITASPPLRTTYSIACFQWTIQYVCRQLVGEESSLRWAKQSRVSFIHSPGVTRTHSLWVTSTQLIYRGAGKSLASSGRIKANVSVRMAWISFGALPCRKKVLDDSSRLDVVEITRVPDMLPSLFPSWSG